LELLLGITRRRLVSVHELAGWLGRDYKTFVEGELKE
jgi:hypothetical protein